MKKNLLGISLITITGLYVLLAAVIILIVAVLGYPIGNGILLSIIILALQFLISPYLTDLSMKWFYKASFDRELPDYVKNFVNEICQKEGMNYPKIGYIDDGAPNAFTYGHTKNDARIILTRGIFELLSVEEIKAVIGHEMGHATHNDMLFMTVAQLVPLIFYGIYEMFTSSNDDNNSSSRGAIIGLIAYILYCLSNYVILWLSRTREYYADSYSIEVTKNPNALASALVKIGYGLTTTADGNKKHSVGKSNALGIFDSRTSKSLIVCSYNEEGKIDSNIIKNAMKWEMWNVWAKWYELNSTHPLISNRLLKISERSREFNQEPFIVFDLQKTESYVDDFAIEVIINFLPIFGLLVSMLFMLITIPILKINILMSLGIAILIMLLCWFIKFKRRYKNTNYKETTVRDLLGEVKVSNITSIPCTLEGNIIGRGNPGCIFNEDFVIKDSTGIIFLDYNQPIHIVNKIFALFKSQEYFDKKVKVTGWYRRSPVPYVEIKTMEIDGQVKKVYTYRLNIVIAVIAFLLGLFLIIMGL